MASVEASGRASEEYYHRAMRITVLGDSGKSCFITQALSNAGRMTLLDGGGPPDADGWRRSTCLLSPVGSEEEVIKLTIMECGHDYSRYSHQIDHLMKASPITILVVPSKDTMPSAGRWLDRIIAASADLPTRPKVTTVVLHESDTPLTGDGPVEHFIDSLLPGTPVLNCDPTDPRSALKALQSIIHPS
ncbi:hypothetical protein FOZ63_002899 [Perkinsus olseni]|uniref:Uncharacterized protein n=1 Tax=Perkinsus olseni TaxID=32597 RepID=A0A7J6P4T8_PEROL|nr:hypothetical protein FOZ60_016116 [Perkinsus olseni]KAF4733278.1 hypothetical protein FOZ62_027614 [Perkinsus olseni]KAF4749380.1 hypothetical protein FOZ63_002899 [Perkinsus olseni]